LKEKGKTFTPVTMDGVASSFAAYTNSISNKKSMFAGFNMGSIPENITFRSPNGKHREQQEDDDSTIATQEQEERFKTTGEDEDDDDDSWDSKLGEDNDMEVDDNSEVEKLHKQLEELKNIVTGVYQTKSKDSAESGKTKGSTPTKKKKTNEGSAASVAGASRSSHHSAATHGTRAREEKRKSRSMEEDPSKKDE